MIFVAKDGHFYLTHISPDEIHFRNGNLDTIYAEPVPDDKINEVMEYCENDVRATEALFHARFEN